MTRPADAASGDYWDEHARSARDADARGPAMFHVEAKARTW